MPPGIVYHLDSFCAYGNVEERKTRILNIVSNLASFHFNLFVLILPNAVLIINICDVYLYEVQGFATDGPLSGIWKLLCWE
jgi:hypothetical protein